MDNIEKNLRLGEKYLFSPGCNQISLHVLNQGCYGSHAFVLVELIHL